MLLLTYSKKGILAVGTTVNQVPKFKITGTKLYVDVVALSSKDNTKLLKRLESNFKKKINWNTYHFKNQVQLKANI